MNSIHRFGIAAAFVVISGVASVVAAPDLPSEMVTLWSAAGEPDGTISKPIALALIPAASALIVGLLAIVPRIDPLRKNIESFRPVYDWFAIVFAAFMAVIHGGIIAYNLGYEYDFTLLVLAAVAGLLYFVGIVLTHAERNWFVGIRTPWTMSSEEVWDRTNELGGRLFKLTAVITLIGLLFDDYAIYFLLVPVLLAAGITVVYSYYLYERVEEGHSRMA